MIDWERGLAAQLAHCKYGTKARKLSQEHWLPSLITKKSQHCGGHHKERGEKTISQGHRWAAGSTHLKPLNLWSFSRKSQYIPLIEPGWFQFSVTCNHGLWNSASVNTTPTGTYTLVSFDNLPFFWSLHMCGSSYLECCSFSLLTNSSIGESEAQISLCLGHLPPPHVNSTLMSPTTHLPVCSLPEAVSSERTGICLTHQCIPSSSHSSMPASTLQTAAQWTSSDLPSTASSGEPSWLPQPLSLHRSWEITSTKSPLILLLCWELLVGKDLKKNNRSESQLLIVI